MTLPRYVVVASLALLGACVSLDRNTFADEEGAIRGYDPVAYFTEGKPVKGARGITASFGGATYHFKNTTKRDLFEGDSAHYAPQYGGYCAYAMSKGFVVQMDPQAWTVHHDKLYLNYSLGVRETWLEDISENIAKADKHWTKKITGS